MTLAIFFPLILCVLTLSHSLLQPLFFYTVLVLELLICIHIFWSRNAILSFWRMPFNFDLVTKFSYSNFNISELIFFCTVSMHHNCFDKWSDGKKSSVKQKKTNKRNETKQNKMQKGKKIDRITCNMSAKSRFNQ